jgi:hypothetical protein
MRLYFFYMQDINIFFLLLRKSITNKSCFVAFSNSFFDHPLFSCIFCYFSIFEGCQEKEKKLSFFAREHSIDEYKNHSHNITASFLFF